MQTIVAGDEGAEHLSMMLAGNDALRKVIVSSNMIADDGIIAISDALCRNTSVTTLVRAAWVLNRGYLP